MSTSLASFVPADRRAELRGEGTVGCGTDGAVLFADISGFTSLTERLQQEHGRRLGAERLSAELDRIYELLVAAVHAWRGSVIGFSGDAIQCWFEARGEGPRGATLAAASAAQAMLQAVSGLRLADRGRGASVSIKVGVATGRSRRAVVGDPDIQLHEVLGGDAARRAAAAERLAEQGELVVDETSARLLDARAVVGAWRHDGVAFAQIAAVDAAATDPWPSLSLPDDQARPWCPARFRSQGGQSRLAAALRPAVALFVSFHGIDDRSEEGLAALNTWVTAVQQGAHRLGGDVVQVTLGDKGSYLYLTFGGMLALEHPEQRAVETALLVRRLAADSPVVHTTQMGLAQGMMYAGPYGAGARHCLGVLGTDVNLAARLMGRASPGQILATQRVVDRLRHEVVHPLGRERFKGFDEPIPIYTVAGLPTTFEAPSRRAVPVAQVLVGRVEERAALAEAVAALSRGARGVVLVEGEAGMGKTRLLAELDPLAVRWDVVVVRGQADEVKRTAAYHAFAPIMARLLGTEIEEDGVVTGVLAAARLLADAELAPLLPTLEALVPLDGGDGTAIDRTEQLEVLVMASLERLVDRPVVVVIEDAHWLDSGSWRLLERLLAGETPFLLAISHRPMARVPPELARIRAGARTRRLPLGAVSAADVAVLASRALGVDELPPRVAEFIARRTEGHPFYTEELARALRDAGILVVEGDTCRLTSSLDEAEWLPDSVHAVVSSRLDRLPPEAHEVVRMASVLGREVDLGVLRALLPKGRAAGLGAQLEVLAGRELLVARDAETVAFRHDLLRQVAYSSLLDATRVALHRDVALHLEAHGVRDGSFHAVLAHHWEQAAEPDQAVPHLEQAAGVAARQGSSAEASVLYARALELEQQMADRPDALARARWEVELARARFRANDIEGSLRSGQRALALAGEPMPTTPARQTMALARGLLRHLVGRWIKRRATAFDRTRFEVVAEAFSVLHLGWVFNTDPVAMGISVFSLAHFGRRAGRADLEAIGLVFLAVVFSSRRLRRLSREAAARAVRLIEGLDDQAAANARVWLAGLRVAQGDLEEARRMVRLAMVGARDGRQWRTLDVAQLMHRQVLLRTGRLEACWDAIQSVREDAVRQRASVPEMWATLDGAWCLYLLGRLDEVMESLDRFIAMPAAHLDGPGMIWCHGLRAVCSLRLGRPGEAEREAAQARQLLDQFPFGHPAIQFGLYALSEYTLERARRGEAGALVEAGAIRAYQWSHARRYPVARAGAWAFDAWYFALQGQIDAALRAADEALTLATARGLPVEGALAQYHLALSLPPGEPRRLAARLDAVTRLEALGMVAHLRRLEGADAPAVDHALGVGARRQAIATEP